MNDTAKILADLDRHMTIFDLDATGLGDRLLDVAVEGVRTNFDQQLDPEGNRWPELSDSYGAWKGRHYPGEPMGVLEEVMRSELDGGRAVTNDSAVVQCGESEEGIEHASWFQEGDAESNRPARPFYGLNDGSRDNSKELLDTHFKANV